MKDAPVLGFGGWSRAMQKQRLHDYCSAARDDARLNWTSGPPGCNVLRGQSPIAVRSRDDLQRAIINAAVIQVQTDGEHLLQNRRRRLNMLNALLGRPRTESRQIVPFLHADR